MHGRLGVEGAQTPSVLWVRRVSGSPLLPRWARSGREGRAPLGWKEAGLAECQGATTRTTPHPPPEAGFQS